MARHFLTPIDMNGNEVRNLLLHVLAVDPATPDDGQVWYNSADEMFRGYDGTAVVDFGSPGAITAAMVSYAGGPGMSATDVEAAIDELATEKANLAGGATFTGAIDMTGATVTVPTATPGDNDTSAASTAFVAAALAALVDSAPGTLDTLNELAAALGDDPNFATTIATALGLKTEKYAEDIGDGAATSIPVTHNLGSRDVVVSVHDAATYEDVGVGVTKTDANTVTLTFAVAPANDAYRVVVIG